MKTQCWIILLGSLTTASASTNNFSPLTLHTNLDVPPFSLASSTADTVPTPTGAADGLRESLKPPGWHFIEPHFQPAGTGTVPSGRASSASTLSADTDRSPLHSAVPQPDSTPAPMALSHENFGYTHDELYDRMDVYRRLDRGGYLNKPELPSENLVVRALDNTFRPEFIRVGKAEMSFSLLTAIKRKNPLCLLNPLVFQLSW
jgi:hypothetical protein